MTAINESTATGEIALDTTTKPEEQDNEQSLEYKSRIQSDISIAYRSINQLDSNSVYPYSMLSVSRSVIKPELYQLTFDVTPSIVDELDDTAGEIEDEVYRRTEMKDSNNNNNNKQWKHPPLSGKFTAVNFPSNTKRIHLTEVNQVTSEPPILRKPPKAGNIWLNSQVSPSMAIHQSIANPETCCCTIMWPVNLW